MADPSKLHAYARQKCIDRYAHWSAVYEAMPKGGRDQIGWQYSEEERRVFPRYNVDQAVLDAIEQINPDYLPQLEDLRKHLLEAALHGSSAFTEPFADPVHDTAMADERQWLKGCFERVTVAEISRQIPLFYRRVLAAGEAADLQQTLKNIWGAEGYWFPLGDRTDPSLVAYDLAQIDEPLLKKRIKKVLFDGGETRMFEFREWGPSYEIDIGEADFDYNGAEGFWTDVAGTWVVYSSHENTITLGGSLAMAFKHVVKGQIADPK